MSLIGNTQEQCLDSALHSALKLLQGMFDSLCSQIDLFSPLESLESMKFCSHISPLFLRVVLLLDEVVSPRFYSANPRVSIC